MLGLLVAFFVGYTFTSILDGGKSSRDILALGVFRGKPFAFVYIATLGTLLMLKKQLGIINIILFSFALALSYFGTFGGLAPLAVLTTLPSKYRSIGESG
jgi:hypothetical protein